MKTDLLKQGKMSVCLGIVKELSVSFLATASSAILQTGLPSGLLQGLLLFPVTVTVHLLARELH